MDTTRNQDIDDRELVMFIQCSYCGKNATNADGKVATVDFGCKNISCREGPGVHRHLMLIICPTCLANPHIGGEWVV